MQLCIVEDLSSNKHVQVEVTLRKGIIASLDERKVDVSMILKKIKDAKLTRTLEGMDGGKDDVQEDKAASICNDSSAEDCEVEVDGSFIVVDTYEQGDKKKDEENPLSTDRFCLSKPLTETSQTNTSQTNEDMTSHNVTSADVTNKDMLREDVTNTEIIKARHSEGEIEQAMKQTNKAKSVHSGSTDLPVTLGAKSPFVAYDYGHGAQIFIKTDSCAETEQAPAVDAPTQQSEAEAAYLLAKKVRCNELTFDNAVSMMKYSPKKSAKAVDRLGGKAGLPQSLVNRLGDKVAQASSQTEVQVSDPTPLRQSH